MYQFDLAAEQLSTDLMLSPSSNSPIQMQLEMSLEKRRGISCAVPPSPTAFLAQKAREKRERQSVQKREKREAVCRDFWLLTRKRTTGIARLKRDNLPPFSKAPKPRRWSPWFSMAQRSDMSVAPRPGTDTFQIPESPWRRDQGYFPQPATHSLVIYTLNPAALKSFSAPRV